MTVSHHACDVLIIGAGAAGLMCAIAAGRRGRQVAVLDHANKPGKKILMSGGGRCNFTNLEIDPERYLSGNPHFCRSALSRFSQWDFIAWLERHRIPYHEKKQGRLFCDRSSRDILDMLLKECRQAGVTLHLNTRTTSVERQPRGGFHVTTNQQHWHCRTLVVATGGLSIPKMGASPFGYRVAESFAHSIVRPRAGLVPFVWKPEDKARYGEMRGISLHAAVSSAGQSFQEDILFTHRGLSGPAILQISSYWEPGVTVTIDLCPQRSIKDTISKAIQAHPQQKLKTLLSRELPIRLIPTLLPNELIEKNLGQLSTWQIDSVNNHLHQWHIVPEGTEGYRTAEVTLGGVSCDELSSKTMQSKLVPNLYFIGEVVDVTGQLGGYNFQWAWSSGWCAGEIV